MWCKFELRSSCSERQHSAASCLTTVNGADGRQSQLLFGHVLCTRQSVQWAVVRPRTVHTAVRSVSCEAATYCAHGSPFSELWGWSVPTRRNHRYPDSDFCPFSFQARTLPSLHWPWPHCSTFLHTQHLEKSSVNNTQSLNNRRNNQTIDECE